MAAKEKKTPAKPLPKKATTPLAFLDALKPPLARLWQHLRQITDDHGVVEASIEELAAAMDCERPDWIRRWLKQLEAIGLVVEVESPSERDDVNGGWVICEPRMDDDGEGQE